MIYDCADVAIKMLTNLIYISHDDIIYAFLTHHQVKISDTWCGWHSLLDFGHPAKHIDYYVCNVRVCIACLVLNIAAHLGNLFKQIYEVKLNVRTVKLIKRLIF